MPEPGPPEPTPGDAGDRDTNPVADLFAPLLQFHNEHPIYFWAALVGLIAAGLAIGALIAPEVVVDQFLWKNFWGPTQTDAEQIGRETRNGVLATEDYTLLSELIYGVILAGALVSIYYHLFKKRGITVDGRFIFALMPYVLFGPLARSMEDASVFCEAGTTTGGACEAGLFSWLFISPFLYIFTAAAVIAHLLLAYETRRDDARTQHWTVGLWLAAQVALYAVIYYGARDQFAIMIQPYTFAALALVSFGVYAFFARRGGDHMTWSLASWGLPMMLVPVVLIARWELVGPWLERSQAELAKAAPEIIWVSLGMTALVLLLVAGVAYLLRNDAREFGYFLVPLNLGLIAGHMLDAFATFGAICSDTAGRICSGAMFLGVETSGYGEKHPVSEFFLGFADGWGFPAMKLLLVVVIIILIDRSAEEGDEDPNLIGLVKLAVLVLGLAPGVRDVVRVALGV